MAKKDGYTVTVVIHRSHGDDDEVLADKFPGMPFGEAAMRQTVEELQECCDELGMPAGLFSVVKVEDGDAVVEFGDAFAELEE